MLGASCKIIVSWMPWNIGSGNGSVQSITKTLLAPTLTKKSSTSYGVTMAPQKQSLSQNINLSWHTGCFITPGNSSFKIIAFPAELRYSYNQNLKHINTTKHIRWVPSINARVTSLWLYRQNDPVGAITESVFSVPIWPRISAGLSSLSGHTADNNGAGEWPFTMFE